MQVLSYDNAMQRLEDKAFRTLSSSASSASASAASKRLLERGLSKLKAGRAKNCTAKPARNNTLSKYRKSSIRIRLCIILDPDFARLVLEVILK